MADRHLDLLDKARGDQRRLKLVYVRLDRDKMMVLQQHDTQLCRLRYELERKIPSRSVPLDVLRIPAWKLSDEMREEEEKQKAKKIEQEKAKKKTEKKFSQVTL